MSSEQFDFEQYRLATYEHWGVFLHEDQSYLGRNYVALKRGGDNEEMDPFLDTTTEERDEFLTIVSGISTVLDELYQPTRLNYTNLRNTWRHCHWHIVPRYEVPELGIREVEGYKFYDFNLGVNYTPTPKREAPPEVVSRIIADMTEGLAAVR